MYSKGWFKPDTKSSLGAQNNPTKVIMSSILISNKSTQDKGWVTGYPWHWEKLHSTMKPVCLECLWKPEHLEHASLVARSVYSPQQQPWGKCLYANNLCSKSNHRLSLNVLVASHNTCLSGVWINTSGSIAAGYGLKWRFCQHKQRIHEGMGLYNHEFLWFY